MGHSHDHHGHSHEEHDHAHEHHHEHDHSHDHDEEAGVYAKAIVTFLLLLGGLALDYLSRHQAFFFFFKDYVRLLYYSIPYLLIGWNVIKLALRSITKGDIFNEFFLMSLATVGAFYIGEYPEGVAVMLFYQVGEYFQEAAVKRAKQSIKALLDVRPNIVTLLRENTWVSVNPAVVKTGDIIQIKAGERVALDGVLTSGDALFDTAALTGESKPLYVCAGEKVLAGMINLNYVAEVKVTALFKDSKLSRILALTQEASSRKGKTHLFISRFAKVYTPIVVLLAVGITFIPYFYTEQYVFNEWLYRALVFLVISCPCALVISIPLGYFGGIGLASRHGILFKGALFLDVMTQVDTIVMDKTGTLTKGVYHIQKVEAEGIDADTLVEYVSALESQSSHPVAQAIVRHYGKEVRLTLQSTEEIAGYGLSGNVGGKKILAGNHKLMLKYGIVFSPVEKHHSDTVVHTAIDGKYSGYFVVSDELREDALSTVKTLQALNIKTVMLSGDKNSVVQETAGILGIDEAYGELLPEGKVAHAEALKKEGCTLAFVGDGINDAPVLALADVGIAMGGLGSDVAVETADVVIQNTQLSKIVSAIQTGKLTRSIVWQNIGLAFGVKCLVLILGAWGVANLWEAVFADVGVALLAILNAVRIQHKKI